MLFDLGLNRFDKVGRDGMSQAVVGRIHAKSRPKHNWHARKRYARLHEVRDADAYAPGRLNLGWVPGF